MTTRVYERYRTNCPYVRAREYLHGALQGVVDNQRTVTLTLKAGTLEKPVLVTYERGEDPMRFDEPWLVHWTPKDGGPYPDFDGEIIVRADESYRSAILELRGEYTPPLGTFGQAFDLLVGSRIAAATARTLLEQIARIMETRFCNEEASKTLLAKHPA
ncbi:MAG TPA: hypothetical protein VFO29_02845 [Candidatus Rubrimentiphilum sp.]|nr:hypothetical protein [Candidatus Rubrimentiphilum sp.]